MGKLIKEKNVSILEDHVGDICTSAGTLCCGRRERTEADTMRCDPMGDRTEEI